MGQDHLDWMCNFCFRPSVMTLMARQNSWYREAAGLPRKKVQVCAFHKEAGQKYLGGRWGLQR